MSRGLSFPNFAPSSRLRQRQTGQCASLPASHPWLHQPSRNFLISSVCRDKNISDAESLPRWRATPPKMIAPVRIRPRPIRFNEFVVNEDPELLDTTYVQVLGNQGDKMLTEEVKWLAVTHKSFDHGRRGYNDRLSFLGS